MLAHAVPFQSPSRWGWCCIRLAMAIRICASFQSPSRWGWCCIPASGGTYCAICGFQSPSRWGRCCIVCRRCVGLSHRSLSVPFSMGTGVASVKGADAGAARIRTFSPLLDGDGVASAPEHPHSTPLIGTRKAFSSRIWFLRPTARDLRILSLPYVPTIVRYSHSSHLFRTSVGSGRHAVRIISPNSTIAWRTSRLKPSSMGIGNTRPSGIRSRTTPYRFFHRRFYHSE